MKIASIEIHNDQIGQWVKNKRINVLILRFIASLMVVAVHLRFILNLGSEHNTIAFSIAECISIIGVNIFIACTAISSFMKEKNNWKRYAIIVLILYVYFWIKQIIRAINHQEVDYLSIFLPIFGHGLWYLRTYVIFYPLIPIINKGLKNFNLALTFIVFYLIFTVSQFFVLREFNISNGYHILHFIFFYMFIRAILIVGSLVWKWKKQIAIISGSFYCTVLISDILATFFWTNSTSYSGFVVIMLAIFFVIFLMSLDIRKNRITKFIGLLGSYSLWFYILDAYFGRWFNDIVIPCCENNIVMFISVLVTKFFMLLGIIICKDLILKCFNLAKRKFLLNRNKHQLR